MTVCTSSAVDHSLSPVEVAIDGATEGSFLLEMQRMYYHHVCLLTSRVDFADDS